MNRDEKATAVAGLADQFNRATVALLATSQGLSVGKIQQLRQALKAVGGEYRVAKNTFVRRAVKDGAFAKLGALLRGPNGVVFGYSDPVAVTKVLVKFAEGNEKLAIKGGVIGEQLLEPTAVADLAKLPSREVLLAMLLGVLQAPATQLLRTMQEPGSRITRLVDQVRSRLEEKS